MRLMHLRHVMKRGPFPRQVAHLFPDRQARLVQRHRLRQLPTRHMHLRQIIL